MITKEYGAWPSRNVTSGGSRWHFDEFNKGHKGDPFNKEYKKETEPLMPEFPMAGIKEYNRYPEQKNLAVEHEKQQKTVDTVAAGKKNNMRRRVSQQVAMLAAGSVVVTSTYVTQTAKAAERNQTPGTDTPGIVEPTPVPGNKEDDVEKNYSVSWEWNEDHTAVTMIVTGEDGEVIKEVPAEITTKREPATCKTAGKLIRTAAAEYAGEESTDVQEEVIPALGHSFDDGKEITLDDGGTAMDFICTRCGEHFTIRNTVTEE